MTIGEIKNSNNTVKEKLDMLNNFKEDIKLSIAKAEEDILKGYKWCPKCKEYYRTDTYITTGENEVRNICTYRDAGYGDDDEWNDVAGLMVYEICPLGHKKEVKFINY